MFVFVVPFAMLFPVMFLVMLPVIRHIYIVVPSVAHKIDRSAASVIFLTVFAPILFMAGRYVQIERLYDDRSRWRCDHDWLWVNDFRRRRITNVNTPVKAGFAYTDRDGSVSDI